MAEKEYLGLEAGLGAAADEEEIEEQAEQTVEQGEEHGLASSQARRQVHDGPDVQRRAHVLNPIRNREANLAYGP